MAPFNSSLIHSHIVSSPLNFLCEMSKSSAFFTQLYVCLLSIQPNWLCVFLRRCFNNCLCMRVFSCQITHRVYRVFGRSFSTCVEKFLCSVVTTKTKRKSQTNRTRTGLIVSVLILTRRETVIRVREIKLHCKNNGWIRGGTIWFDFMGIGRTTQRRCSRRKSLTFFSIFILPETIFFMWIMKLFSSCWERLLDLWHVKQISLLAERMVNGKRWVIVLFFLIFHPIGFFFSIFIIEVMQTYFNFFLLFSILSFAECGSNTHACIDLFARIDLFRCC